ncbi:hypothetical protein [Brevibacterium renqingii]|uniref:hypothetical protein n=1 Tax=Brevibacterium renqingii TaxID=2776916 RepID=UPI001AE04A88|nr:hypothetical protein [Brevibacterium renqingii]
MSDNFSGRISRSLRKAAINRKFAADYFPVIEQACTEIEEIRERYSVVPGERVWFAIQTRTSAPTTSNSALLEIRALGRDGTRQSIPGWGFVSGRVGEYHYIEVEEENQPSITKFAVRVPSNVVEVELVGHRWKRDVRTQVVGSITVWNSLPGRIPTTDSGIPIELPADQYMQEEQLPDRTGTVSVRLPIRGGTTAGRVPIAVSYFNGSEEIMPVADMAQHKDHGPIVLFDSEPYSSKMIQFDLTIPDGATEVALKGLDWGSSTPTILNNADLYFSKSSDSEIDQFLTGLESTDRLLVIDTTAPPVGHETLSLRPNNLTLAWAKLGINVIFLPFSSIQDQSMRPIPGVLQVGREMVGRIRDWLVENRQGAMNTYVCSSFPDADSVAAIDVFNALGWNTVYECRDDMEEFNRVGYSKWYNVQLERRVVESANTVTAVSHSLANKLKSLTSNEVDVTVTPNGVSADLIGDCAELRTMMASEHRAQSHVFGYVGHLTDAWFDWDLLITAATARPRYVFEVVGHGIPTGVEFPENVRYLGPKTHEELRSIVANWRAGLIPFIESPLTRSVDPNKIYEYFAWGLPCISAPMGSVHEYVSTYVYRNIDEFLVSLDRVASESVGPKELANMNQFLEECSWAARARQTSELFFRGE